MVEIARRAAQAQLDAYNAQDIDAFVACYTEGVEVFDLKTGERSGQGREWMRAAYAEMFARYPDCRAQVTTRSVVGNVVFDHELVTGRGEPLIVMAIYEVDPDGLIARVWFVR